MAKRKSKRVPAYRLHKRSGQAVVTLTDAIGGKRRDVYLGEYGSAPSRKAYAEVLARWEDDGRIMDGRGAKPSEQPPPMAKTVRGVAVAHWLSVNAVRE